MGKPPIKQWAIFSGTISQSDSQIPDFIFFCVKLVRFNYLKQVFSRRSCNICILIAHKQSAPGAPRLGNGGNGAISSQISILYSEPRIPEIIHVPVAVGKSLLPKRSGNHVIFHICAQKLVTYGFIRMAGIHINLQIYTREYTPL